MRPAVVPALVSLATVFAARPALAFECPRVLPEEPKTLVERARAMKETLSGPITTVDYGFGKLEQIGNIAVFPASLVGLRFEVPPGYKPGDTMPPPTVTMSHSCDVCGSLQDHVVGLLEAGLGFDAREVVELGGGTESVSRWRLALESETRRQATTEVGSSAAGASVAMSGLDPRAFAIALRDSVRSGLEAQDEAGGWKADAVAVPLVIELIQPAVEAQRIDLVKVTVNGERRDPLGFTTKAREEKAAITMASLIVVPLDDNDKGYALYLGGSSRRESAAAILDDAHGEFLERLWDRLNCASKVNQ